MPKPPPLSGDVVAVRYLERSVPEAVDFYTRALGFELVFSPAPEFAIVANGSLRLLLSQPMEERGGTQRMPDGTMQAPGGWNRIVVEVDNLESRIEAIKASGGHFRNDAIVGVGQNKQILLEDPSGNLIELIEY